MVFLSKQFENRRLLKLNNHFSKVNYSEITEKSWEIQLKLWQSTN